MGHIQGEKQLVLSRVPPKASQAVNSTKRFGGLYLFAVDVFGANLQRLPTNPGRVLQPECLAFSPPALSLLFLLPRLLPQLSPPFSPGVSFFIQINCHRFCPVLDLPPFLGEPSTPLALDSIWVSLAGSHSLRGGRGTQSNLHICFPTPY